MADSIVFRKNHMISTQAFARVLEASGIKRPTKDEARLSQMLRHSNYLWTAWEGDKLVGVARALTDYAYVCYISDLAVDQAYQGQGIGKQLLSFISEDLGDAVALVLLSAPSAMSYYPKLGFEQSDKAFIIPRKPF
ncbi:GNAT family N-acetyltransferase [Streptococcus equi subsp. zooepidemicus]|nr:GNAT family N-acetyltransferase [Streptococcus equi]KIS07385.1 acetyltransferase [Streptococcus equi subsp. zooepidemicus Sz5]KIS19837.1 acetyltransferase [Streptococcus equi subsp. zooepidemicus Sz35]MCD3399112.1 GNAT family N-acetyltransferase [Streptococcus equi subsp. zooepidemicus]MCD3402622.1 GNAT family N-acetyltransferase [Streptococcus equi subsp. zooepidemicus]MCD3406414.1 GNAT family N-acetyltransferase [Streptococcus equi subsp. zooepidemicus]